MSDKIRVSEVFKLPVNGAIQSIICDIYVNDNFDDGVAPYDVAEMAINNHDKLVDFINSLELDVKGNIARNELLEALELNNEQR